MHTEYTRLFFVCLKSLKLHLGQNILENGLFLERMFKILKTLTNSSRRILLSNKNFASVIRNFLSFSAPTFSFEVFFTKSTASQVSVDSFKVSVVRCVREVSVL